MTVRIAAPRPFKPFSKPEKSAGSITPFALFDRRQRFDEIPPRRRRTKGPGPRIWLFDGSDDAYTVPAEKPKPHPGDPIDGTHLYRRLLALETALGDLPSHAKRMARAMARRKLAPPGPKRVGPIRAGLPPGHRARGKYEADEILRACHLLAFWTLKAPDTS